MLVVVSCVGGCGRCVLRASLSLKLENVNAEGVELDRLPFRGEKIMEYEACE